MKLLSMFDISLHAANVIYGLSNTALVTGAALVLLGTVGSDLQWRSQRAIFR
jgi:hypothetical protein